MTAPGGSEETMVPLRYKASGSAEIVDPSWVRVGGVFLFLDRPGAAVATGRSVILNPP
jgi:hypothetical protein